MTLAAGREAFAAACAGLGIDVSRETLGALQVYADLLTQANETTNLVSASTLPDLWTRHFFDSAQLLPLLPATARRIVDLGSGAGFPGLVLAILLADVPDVEIHLIEATQKKARFLADVIAATGAPALVHARRAEDMAPLTADAITARAVAPLDALLGFAAPFVGPGTVCLFLKGRNLASELTEASKSWHIDSDVIASRSDPSGQILRVERFRRVPGQRGGAQARPRPGPAAGDRGGQPEGRRGQDHDRHQSRHRPRRRR